MPSSLAPSLPLLGLGSEERLRELADLLPDGLFTTDLEGTVTFWNRAAEQITGWTREEAVGRNCSLLAGDSVNGCSCGGGPLRCDLARTGKSSKQCSIRTRDGSDLVIVKNAVPLLDGGPVPVGALETFTAVGTPATLGAPGCELAAAPHDELGGLVGRHPAMLELFHMIALVARSESTVLILGESGSGKERVAEAIHRQSLRAGGPFVRTSCSTPQEDRLESELFGHAEGAFPGALRERRGRFQEAEGGTLLLDEIGDAPPAVQAKLVRVVQEREIERLGAAATVPVNVRLLCSTQRDLRQLVAEGRFRADLYFRLAVFPLRVPPLREHADDVPLLAGRVLARLPGAPRLAADAVEALRAYPWPGNVRELENVLEFAALRAAGAEVTRAHLPAELTAGKGRRAPPAGGADLERAALVAALEQSGGNRTRAARKLGVSRVTLWKRMRRFGLLSLALGLAERSTDLAAFLTH